MTDADDAEDRRQTGRAPVWVPWAIAALVGLPRVGAFLATENLYGDSVARVGLARLWLKAPHWMWSFGDGAWQYGPLHLELLGGAIALDAHAQRAGQWLSLIFGVLTAWPLYALTRRLFDWRAGVFACVGLALWGLHIQTSTTAASEVPALFFLLVALAALARWRDTPHLGWLVAAAAAMNAAMATRYDPWLLAPVLVLGVALHGPDRKRAFLDAALFAILCAPFPLSWMIGNGYEHGDPLFPIRYTDQYHSTWSVSELARMGQVRFRLRGLFFWPGAALFTLSPGFAALGSWGAIRRFRRARWLVALIAVPTAYFTFRSAVLANFTPLARFAIPQIALLLPFAWPGLQSLPLSAVARRWVLGVTVALAVALPVGLTAFTFGREGLWENSFRPVSPVTTNPAAVRAAAKAINSIGEPVLLDADPNLFMDIQIESLVRLPEEAFSRVRYEQDLYTSALRSRTVLLVDGGMLARSPEVRVQPGSITIDGVRFVEVPGVLPPFHVYRR